MDKILEFSPLCNKCVVAISYLQHYRIDRDTVIDICKKRCGVMPERKKPRKRRY